MILLALACSSDPEPPVVVEVEAPVEEPEPVVEPVDEVVEPEPVDEVVDPEPVEEVVEPEPVEEAVEPAPVEEVVEPEPVEEVVDPEPEAEPEPEPARTVTYTLTPAGSSIYVKVLKDPDTVGADLSHDHVIAASGWTGTATWNADDPSVCALSVTVPVKKLVVDSPKMRAAVGLDGTLDEGQRADVKKNMLAKDQLDAEGHANVSFRATSCAADRVTGDFTLRGVTKSITVPLTVTADAEGFEARGQFQVRGSDYGLDPFTAMLGALKNQDQLSFSVKITGSPR